MEHSKKVIWDESLLLRSVLEKQELLKENFIALISFCQLKKDKNVSEAFFTYICNI